MKQINQYENEKVLVLGLAVTGVNAAMLLKDLGAIVVVNDMKPLEENPSAKKLVEAGVRVITGSHPVELLEEDFLCMVKNPGIPYTNPMVVRAIELGLPVITDVELAYQVLDAHLIGITGTNGKTTTTTMVQQILDLDRQSGKAYLAGNIGVASTQVARIAKPEDNVVMELSSFQLMGIDTFHPHIAVITNIFSAHLDYHASREEYVQAKWNITKNQTTEDFLVYNYDSEELRLLAETSAAKSIPFSTKVKLEEGASFVDGQFLFNGEYVMSASDLKVPGSHNVENALAAIAVAKLMAVPNEVIIKAFSTFHGVRHRMQFVRELKGRKFYNDSKATNVLATQTALLAFTSPVILLAGGLDRGNDFDDLKDSLKFVKTMIVFGETKAKLKALANELGIQVFEANDVSDGTKLAYDASQEGDTILLSPACASWDQFKNFEIRGDRFIEAVEELN